MPTAKSIRFLLKKPSQLYFSHLSIICTHCSSGNTLTSFSRTEGLGIVSFAFNHLKFRHWIEYNITVSAPFTVSREKEACGDAS